MNHAATPGDFCRTAAWKVRNLITIFGVIAKKPHRPRERNVRKLFRMVGIDMPEGLKGCHAHVMLHIRYL